MKKSLFILLASLILVIASGCSSDKTETASTPANQTEASNQTESNSANASSSEETSMTTKTLDDVLAFFEEQGITVESKDKPLFEMINAQDGVLFNHNLKPVKIYQYASIDAYNEAKESFSIMDQMLQKGVFVLETNDEEVKSVFEQLP
ncbi:hypothetical protein [Paenibacillus sp. 1001270B_150601_E10]|uniref:hypothetical protein n=1 Tax=Paenibacillus sp. 1001270B_150601_E10 TaxID=2787079 RepID=UPI0018A074E1|nr:hypothetical protein [Paenibacillus sp. 1001270B_150601_E10]